LKITSFSIVEPKKQTYFIIVAIGYEIAIFEC